MVSSGSQKTLELPVVFSDWWEKCGRFISLHLFARCAFTPTATLPRSHTYLRRHLFACIQSVSAAAAAWEMGASSVLSFVDMGRVPRCKQFLWKFPVSSVFVSPGKVAWRVFPQGCGSAGSAGVPHRPPLHAWWRGPYRCICSATYTPLFALLHCLGIKCAHCETQGAKFGALRHSFPPQWSDLIRIEALFYIMCRKVQNAEFFDSPPTATFLTGVSGKSIHTPSAFFTLQPQTYRV